MLDNIGGILALEQIVQDAPDQDAHAAQVLNVFIRRRAPDRLLPPSPDSRRDRITAARRSARHGNMPDRLSLAALPDEPEADVQQALTALTQSDIRTPPDLSRLHLARARLDGAELPGARFTSADLTGAWLDYADLTGAWLTGADLNNAWLTDANLTGAGLTGANLNNAWLTGADLTGAWLGGADFTGAQLGAVNLTGTELREADLTSALGLTVWQVVEARLEPTTQLPPEIAQDPRVIARIQEVLAERSHAQ